MTFVAWRLGQPAMKIGTQAGHQALRSWLRYSQYASLHDESCHVESSP
jgi:hypothetical protein